MINIKFEIPLTPISKKNHQRILINRRTRRPFVMPSSQYKEYENAAMHYIPKVYEPINRPVNIKCLFYMPTKRLCDLTNLLESIDDIMVKARLIDDDNYTIIKGHDFSRVFYDKENPRTEVSIEELD